MRLPNLLTTPTQRHRARRLREQAALEKAKNLTSARRESILSARAFITDFVRSRWETHWDMIRIECGATEAELRALGSLPRDEGVRACCQLVRVPVIYEEIATALWERLAKDVARDGAGGSDTEQPSTAERAPSMSRSTTPWANESSRNRLSREWRRRKSSDATKKSPPAAEEKQLVGIKCVFCTECGELACRIPEEIVQLSRGEVPVDEQPFWNMGEENPEKGRRSSETSKTNTTSRRLDKVFVWPGALTVQKMFVNFVASLAYGYCNQRPHTFAGSVTVLS